MSSTLQKCHVIFKVIIHFLTSIQRFNCILYFNYYLILYIYTCKSIYTEIPRIFCYKDSKSNGATLKEIDLATYLTYNAFLFTTMMCIRHRSEYSPKIIRDLCPVLVNNNSTRCQSQEVINISISLKEITADKHWNISNQDLVKKNKRIGKQ